jgi:hypothetical protein
MKIIIDLFLTVFIITFLFFISCNKSQKKSLSGKWKVEEVGITGLNISYEFRNDTIKIESIFNKAFIDSVGGDLNGVTEERYVFKSDSADILTLEVTDLKSNLKGDYKIQIHDDKMILTNDQGEIFNLKKINK